MILPLEAFNKEVTGGLYTRAFVRTEEPEGISMFSEEWFEETEPYRKKLEALLSELENDRAAEMKAEAYEEIDEEWQEALAELDAAEAEIDANGAKMDSELAKGRGKINSAQNKLNRLVAKYTRKIKEAKAKVKEAEATIKTIDKHLPEAKRYIAEMKALYEGNLQEALEQISAAQEILDKFDGLPTDSDEFKAVAKELSGFVVDNASTIRKVNEFFKKDEVKDLAEKLKDETGIDMTGLVKALGDDFDADALISLATRIYEYGGDIGEIIDQVQAFIDQMNEYINDIRKTLHKLNKYAEYIKTYEANRSGYVAQIKEKKKQIADAEKKLKAERKKYQARIDAGWSGYYASKARYEAKLAEAIALLETNREEAEEKLAEARAEVEKISCSWIMIDRKGNAGYADIRSNIEAFRKIGYILGALFMLITVVVCFSTLTIIIEEQKVMVGTTKAFGFHRSEVLGKYLIFGSLAAAAGCALGVAASVGMAELVRTIYTNGGFYPVENNGIIVIPGLTLICCLIILAVTAAASVMSCLDILRSPASYLMKGAVLRRQKKEKEKKKSSNKGTLYSRLIIRNMMDDKARVIVTTVIIAAGCLMIGLGISLRLSYEAMSERQTNDINKYDIRVSLNDGTGDETSAKIESVLEEKGALYLPATVETRLFRRDGRYDALRLISADPERLGEFFAVTDPVTGEDLALPDDGILIQKRMHESYGMDEGESLPILDDALDQHDAVIKGCFTNYVGRTAVASPAAYRSIFGESAQVNSYYVKLSGADMNEVEKALAAADGGISFESKTDFNSRFESVSSMLNLVVFMMLGIAILMSFMIITNLSNIYLTRKKKELIVMRINGFSVKQTIGYLRRETVLTTAAGIILGIAAGALITPYVISPIQHQDMEFVKDFMPQAWAAAAGLEALFAVVINGFVFRKVKSLDLRDID